MSIYTLDKENHQELCELLEDTVQLWCNEHRISGELAWTVVDCLSKAKLQTFKGRL